MTKLGQILTHPIHGDMTVVDVSDTEQAAYIDDEWRKGRVITADFDKIIAGVIWKNEDESVSRLIFHEYYLKNLEVK